MIPMRRFLSTYMNDFALIRSRMAQSDIDRIRITACKKCGVDPKKLNKKLHGKGEVKANETTNKAAVIQENAPISPRMNSKSTF